jgi:tRNA (cmo5U34)-methyltransferase
VADIGAGTGLLSKLIIDSYPKAKITLVDISEEMLNIAKNRLKQYPNIEYNLSDYSKQLPAGNFDLIVSSLSIHHLSDKSKIKEILYPNGIFINADQILGKSKDIEQTYNSMWLTEAKENGITQIELNDALDPKWRHYPSDVNKNEI